MGYRGMSEKILGNIEVMYIKGTFSGYDKDVLFFTSDRFTPS